MELLKRKYLSWILKLLVINIQRAETLMIGSLILLSEYQGTVEYFNYVEITLAIIEASTIDINSSNLLK